jgi:hypothetical protein
MAAQKVLAEKVDAIKAIDGVTSVQRVVCGGCMDFKAIVACNAGKVTTTTVPRLTWLCVLCSCPSI